MALKWEHFEKVLGMYLPLNCPVCGDIPFDGGANQFCAECLKSFRFIREPACPSCGGEHNGILEVCPDCLAAGRKFPWKRGVAVFRMDGAVKEVIYRFKYREQPELARALGRLAAGAVRSAGLRAELLVPTPLHWVRFLQRGFNQSELLAKVVGKELGIPAVNLLRRTKWTRQQAKLDRDARIRNLEKAFSICGSTNCRGRCILLIDDVMTTGSTLAAAAQTLLEAGAAEVNIMVLARRQRD
ncbi:MAG: DNA utilization protein GntX [Lentisphaerae bacterium ADurb.Bin242]|nr:MAG: DNA utilization protein GntX [Lentisphaerae bacterium ADurb.Bin242]